MWRNLSEESKRPFEEGAKRAKERYGRAMEAFKEGRPFEEEEEEAVPEANAVDNFENLDVLLNDSIVQDESLPAEAEEENAGLSATEFEKLDRLLEDSMRADEEATLEKIETPDSEDVVEGADTESKDSDSVEPYLDERQEQKDEVDAEPKNSGSVAAKPDEKQKYEVDASPESNEVPVSVSNNDDQELSVTTELSSGVKDENSDETPATSEPLPKDSDGKTLSESAELSGTQSSKDAESYSPKDVEPSRCASEDTVDAFEKLDECLNNDSDFEGFDELDSLL